jgi:hypothetical protein
MPVASRRRGTETAVSRVNFPLSSYSVLCDENVSQEKNKSWAYLGTGDFVLHTGQKLHRANRRSFESKRLNLCRTAFGDEPLSAANSSPELPSSLN